MGRRKYNINHLKDHALSKGGSCLSVTYSSISSYYSWSCKHGHKWDATWASVAKGSWCSQCYQKSKSGKKIGSTADHSIAKSKEIISKYETYHEFYENHPHVDAWLRRQGLHKKLTNSLKRINPVTKSSYSFDDLKQIAKKFKTKKAFRAHRGGAYSSAEKKGFLDDICKHMEATGTRHKRAIYIYEFKDHSVYVGLTYNYEKRFKEHHSGSRLTPVKRKISSGVDFDYFEQGEWLPVNEAIESEAWWIEFYRSSGWEILNIAKAGSVGSGLKVWTYEKALNRARKYIYM